jgi:hypothetical protein
MKISKAKLYEARVGVSEVQKKWDERGTGKFIYSKSGYLFDLTQCYLNNRDSCASSIQKAYEF